MRQEDNQLLWKAFTNKIQIEWREKYSEFGTFDQIQEPTIFCQKLAEDINLSLKKPLEPPYLINPHTLYRYVNQQGFGAAKKGTLDIIQRYIGDTHIKEIQAYTKQNSNKIKSQKSNFSGRMFWITGSIITLLTGSFVAYYFIPPVFANDSRIEKESIIDLIDKANALEFSLYSAVPDLSDTISLNTVYTSESINKKNVIQVLKRNKNKGNIVDIKKSSRLLNKEATIFDELTPDYAVVRTIEFWELHWVNAVSKEKYAHYKVVNKQRYELKKQQGKWLIAKNEYQGKAKWF